MSKNSALHERDGVAQPTSVNPNSVAKIRKLRQQKVAVEDLILGISQGDMTALSRGITLVESTNQETFEKAQELIQGCLPLAKKSIRIGITGVPGVGKSTFIESFGNYMTTQGFKVAVLAVDPSSTISHGSILGDKTRMEELVKNPMAYIRPSASGESLGGVARKTRESIMLCEAAGFDCIIIETVGVGQSETAVHSMVDFFLLLKLAGAGDELQGIKRGIMEMADAIVINKADGENIKQARLAKTEFNRALHLFPAKKSGWTPTVTTCSALQNEGIQEVWKSIQDFMKTTQENGYFDSHRAEQNQYWLMETILEQLKQHFFQNENVLQNLDNIKKEVAQNHLSPFAAAKQLWEAFLGK